MFTRHGFAGLFGVHLFEKMAHGHRKKMSPMFGTAAFQGLRQSLETQEEEGRT